MKKLILTNSDVLSVPTLKQLLKDESLAGVGVVKKSSPKMVQVLENLGLKQDEILILDKKNWVEELGHFLKKNQVDVVWVLTFPWIIPDVLLNIPAKGFVNFHFGLLPKYKGADPIFWQLKNGEEMGGITIHRMNHKVDEGPVLMKKELRIIPGENYGLHGRRLGDFAAAHIDDLIQVLTTPEPIQQKVELREAQYAHKPTRTDLTIKWKEQTASEIEWLVNASNPKYQGAITSIADYKIRILEVTPVNMESPIPAQPGQIVHADAVYGLVVACLNNEFVRITVVQTAEGFHSGVKLFNLGFVAGHTFTS